MKLDGAQLATIRELLATAFNSGEIDTLAFDLFQSVYRDFSPGMMRSAKIQGIVQHASDNGRIPDLLFYVEKENPYQYASYAAELGPIWQKLNVASLTREETTRTDKEQETGLEERKQRLSGDSES